MAAANVIASWLPQSSLTEEEAAEGLERHPFKPADES
jgi:hypothetical protein